ncbi:NAD(P)/FAD-dependent oxidoreductase [Paracoccus seriniphilus]|uniref:Glycine/D-amino acid oxidase n=1 Tax=Paracoccus seriniphilus TaxID=184748 RepID=A0A239PVR3_9RHOB|nr:FAD-binding oxidoreductase [Paracoccus seriniphilus]WCR16236.1 FAD-binding oxidoreductase [Paracoccus seriniphilus]SNT73787.1 Glycine/D-amino acid oxidase [Paracoccus seriniphilus]
MKFLPYWHDSTPAFGGAASGPVGGDYDVAVIGAGFTGLGAARKLAMEGKSVIVLEARHVGAGASGRNGGHLNNGLAHSYLAAMRQFGPEKARALYHAFDAGIETLIRIIDEEGIDCNFRRSGKLKLASKPGHMDAMRRNFEAVNREADPETEWLERDVLHDEVRSDSFHAGMLQRRSAMMHMGRFVVGLADAAVRHGAVVHEGATVTTRQKQGAGWRLTTTKGKVTAGQVLLATGAYTDDAFPWFRRRIVPVGSFIIATRPLTETEIAASVPGDRTFVNSMNIGNYFRLTPDRRLIWGGRARFSARSDQRSDSKSGAVLRASLAATLPQLADVGIDYCWGGMVDMTADRFPRAGQADGLWYSMGYSGHGAQIATHMGEIMADRIMGHERQNPWQDLPWQAVPLHTGKPWFLPVVGLYYQLKDKIS